MRRQQALVPFDVSHLPERFGLFTILVLGESLTAVVAGVTHAAWSLRHIFTATIGIGIATAIWWMYFDNTSGTVVRRSAEIRHTWRPTTWIYTHLLLAAAVASLGVALELAVESAGEGPMPDVARWLLVGSTAVALASMALVQFATVTVTSDRSTRAVVTNRLLGVPVLLGLGLLSQVEPMWLALGVLVVCAGEILADWRAAEQPAPVEESPG